MHEIHEKGERRFTEENEENEETVIRCSGVSVLRRFVGKRDGRIANLIFQISKGSKIRLGFWCLKVTLVTGIYDLRFTIYEV